MKSPYTVLGVTSDCSRKDIDKAYRKLALKYHPDRSTGSVKEFKEIVGAYEALCDPHQRENYDNNKGMDRTRPGRRPTRHEEMRQVKEHYQSLIDQLLGQYSDLEEVHKAALARASGEIARLVVQLEEERASNRSRLVNHNEVLVHQITQLKQDLTNSHKEHLRELDEALQNQFEILTKCKLVSD